MPFTRVTPKVKTNKLELVHSDVVGPLSPASIGGKKYILTFIDDSSRRSWVYLMRTKDEVPEHFKEWREMVEKQSEQKVKTLRTDNGREYMSNEFEAYLRREGITHQLTVPYSPQQNGVAKIQWNSVGHNKGQ